MASHGDPRAPLLRPGPEAAGHASRKPIEIERLPRGMKTGVPDDRLRQVDVVSPSLFPMDVPAFPPRGSGSSQRD